MQYDSDAATAARAAASAACLAAADLLDMSATHEEAYAQHALDHGRPVDDEALVGAQRFAAGLRARAAELRQPIPGSAERPDDGPEVFAIYAGDDDPFLFTTHALACKYGEAQWDPDWRCEQQTVCGPTRAASIIADASEED